MLKFKKHKEKGMRKRTGFTLIEVVLVLAIAGLIFLMVFIALPALQRSQRNTRRKSDLARISTAVTDYTTNNKKTPFSYMEGMTFVAIDDNFVPRYIDETCKAKSSFEYNCTGDQFRDPTGNEYEIICSDAYISRCSFARDTTKTSTDLTTKTQEVGQIYAFVRAKCGEQEGTVEKAKGVNEFALITKLEGGAYYCVDSQ